MSWWNGIITCLFSRPAVYLNASSLCWLRKHPSASPLFNPGVKNKKKKLAVSFCLVLLCFSCLFSLFGRFGGKKKHLVYNCLVFWEHFKAYISLLIFWCPFRVMNFLDESFTFPLRVKGSQWYETQMLFPRLWPWGVRQSLHLGSRGTVWIQFPIYHCCV